MSTDRCRWVRRARSRTTQHPVIAQLDELQFTLAEGPCRDAHRTQTPILTPDLLDAGSRGRWPAVAQEASAAGAAAVFA